MCKIKKVLLRLSCSYRKFMLIHRNVLNLKCGEKQQKNYQLNKTGKNFCRAWLFSCLPITELLRFSRNDDVGGLYQQDELKIDALLHIFHHD